MKKTIKQILNGNPANLGHFPRRKFDSYLTKIELLPYAEEWTILKFIQAEMAEFMGYSGFDMEGFAL